MSAGEGTRVPDYILEISEAIEEPKLIKVFDEEYNIRGVAPLSADEEAKVMALLARFERLQLQLATTGDTREGEKLAHKLRDTRIEMLTMLTTVPRDVVARIDLPQQIKLMKAVQAESGLGDEDDLT